jgi:hypothetical protein
MKNALMITTLLFAASLAQAKTVCTIDSATKQDMNFDQVLFSSEVTGAKYVVIDNGHASEIQLSAANGGELLKSNDGKTLVIFGLAPDGTASIGIGHIDMAKADKVLQFNSMAMGSVADQLLDLVVPSKNLSAFCQSLK